MGMAFHVPQVLFERRLSRKPIDFLEGDTMICSVESQGPTWKGKIVRYNMDNQAFQKSAVKGRSRAERLNLLLKRLFVLQIMHNCLLLFSWVSSEDIEMADLLSREGGIERFPEAVARRAFVFAPASLQAMPGAGRVRNLDMSAPFNQADMGICVVFSRKWCCFFPYAFKYILMHFNAFSSFSLHFIQMHSSPAAWYCILLHLYAFMYDAF
jgi:hypothetical protein